MEAGAYPWRLGATSFVVPADLLTNVRELAGRAEAVQLLFFESAAQAGLPHEVDVGALARLAEAHDLRYTVHLPTDIRLGARDKRLRRQGVAEIERLHGLLAPLAPHALDLHLRREEGLAPERWLELVDASLAELAARLGDGRRLLAVENIDYPPAAIWRLAEAHGLGLAVDVGHLLRYGHDLEDALARFLPRARHVHYHGMAEGRDHRAVTDRQQEISIALGRALVACGFTGIVTVEVYDLEQFEQSRAALARAWTGLNP